MESPDLVTVFWAEFEDHVTELCSALYQDRQEADVSLVSSDGARIRAHSFFLCRSSPVLASLLLGQPRPVLHLTGLSEGGLQDLLQFLYLGQVSVGQNKIDELHAVAKDLQISQLENILTSLREKYSEEAEKKGGSCDDFDIIEIDPEVQSIILIDHGQLYEDFLLQHSKPQYKLSDQRPFEESPVSLTEDLHSQEESLMGLVTEFEEISSTDSDIGFVGNVTTPEDVSTSVGLDDYEEDDYQNYEELEIYENIDDEDSGKTNTEPSQLKSVNDKKRILPNLRSNNCPDCGEAFHNKRSVRRHYIKNHVGRRFYCNQCSKNYFEPRNLKRHIRIEHENIRYNCEECESEFTEKKSLSRHKQSVHQMFTVSCQLCEYVTSSTENLRRHTTLVHEGLRYPCTKCDKQFTDKGYLRKHLRAAHDKVRFACKLCDKTYTHRASLTLHVQAHHDKVKYPCNICHMEFNMKRNLLHHFERKHSKTNNVWDLKNYTFQERKRL